MRNLLRSQKFGWKCFKKEDVTVSNGVTEKGGKDEKVEEKNGNEEPMEEDGRGTEAWWSLGSTRFVY